MFFYKSLENSFLIFDNDQDIAGGSCWIKQICSKYSAHGLITYKQDGSKFKFNAKVFNADGSDGQFSGNGLRCLGYHIFKENKDISEILIRMGDNKDYHIILKEKDDYDKNKIITFHNLQNTSKPFRFISFNKSMHFLPEFGVFVNVGNPHILISSTELKDNFLKNIKALQKEDISFLNYNISQYQKISPNRYDLLTVERGVGPTPACSSAALALCNYLSTLGDLDSKSIEINMPGGCLKAYFMPDKVKFSAGVDFIW
jgi:diaminopimelate epimerase